MNKYIIQAFIVLIVILFGVSLISEANDRVRVSDSLSSFEQDIAGNKEVSNGVIDGIYIVEEDSSNLISNINAKMASFLVDGLNKLLGFAIKLLEGMAG